MSTRTRLTAAVAAILSALALSAPAWAGPSDRQPAQVRLTLGEARHYARVGAGYMAVGMNGPHKPRVGKCGTDDTLGRKLWMCGVTLQGADAHCTLVVWVWGTRTGDRIYEYHRLRCTAA